MNKSTAIVFTILFITISNFIIFKYIGITSNSQLELSKELILKQSRSEFKSILNTSNLNSQDKKDYVNSHKPAWMTTQISELANKKENYYYNITSLKPNNPDNKADKFEKKALKYIKDSKESEYYTFNKTNTKFNYVGALIAEPSCLNCHTSQGYKQGDILGGIRITIPTNEFKVFSTNLKEETRVIKTVIIILSVFILLVLIWFINNIYSRQKVIEEISKRNEVLTERYSLALDGTDDGLWDWDLISDEVYFSKKWKSMLGYEDNELKNNLQTWSDLVHPDDIEQAYKDILANQKQETKHYENVHRLRHKSGHWVWILDRGKTIFDEENKAVRMLGFHTDISKQKELELSLNKSQKNLIKAEKMANLGHWSLDLKNMHLEVSENVKNIFGLDKEAIFGMKELFKTFVLEEDRKRVSEKFTQSLRDKKPFKIEYRFNKLNFEETRYINCKVEHKIQDKKVKKLIGTIQDVTDMNSIEKELTILRAAIEHAPISFVITNAKGYIEYVNPAFTKVTGYTFEEAFHKNPKILKSEFTKEEEYEKLWNTISSGRIWSGTFKNINKKGEDFWELAVISPIMDKNNKIVNYLAIKQEITKEVFLQQELQNKEDLMIAQSRHAAMGEMISMIAHQWRQPIAVVAMGANNILADIELDMLDNETLKESLNEIVNQTEYLSQTIDDFKNFFKPNKQKDLTTIESIFDETFKVMGKMLDTNQITVIQEYKSGIQLYTYPKELLQVFINIIKNAKEVLIEKRDHNRLITINEYLKNDYLIIQVSDNAGGIDKDILERIFDPYFTTKDELGTGLGLYMSKTIIEKHLNGQMEAFNKNDGACFQITFSMKDL